MNFRFSPSARLAEESHTNPNCHSEPSGEESLANPNSHSVLDTESVNADFLII